MVKGCKLPAVDCLAMSLECLFVTGLGVDVCLLERSANHLENEPLVGDLISKMMVGQIDVPCSRSKLANPRHLKRC